MYVKGSTLVVYTYDRNTYRDLKTIEVMTSGSIEEWKVAIVYPLQDAERYITNAATFPESHYDAAYGTTGFGAPCVMSEQYNGPDSCAAIEKQIIGR